jgi:hypothetical protein
MENWKAKYAIEEIVFLYQTNSLIFPDIARHLNALRTALNPRGREGGVRDVLAPGFHAGASWFCNGADPKKDLP